MDKLPKEFKKKWVKGLRSGEYKQTTGILYSTEEEGFCCLGVACVVAGMPKDDLALRGAIKGAGFSEEIPSLIKGYANEDNPVVKGLVNLNDDGVPFEVIAGVINEYL